LRYMAYERRGLTHDCCQLQGLVAVSVLLKGKSGAARKAFDGAGAMQLACEALSAYRSDRDVVVASLEALSGLTRGGQADLGPCSRADAARLVVEAMDAWMGDAGVCFQGLRFIQVLAHHQPEFQARLMELGAPQKICDIMSSLAQDRNVVLHGCRSVAHLSADVRQAQEAFTAMGTHIQLLAAMETFRGIKEVEHAALRAVAAVARDHDVCKQNFAREGAFEKITAIMAGAPTDKELILQSCKALTSLAQPQRSGPSDPASQVEVWYALHGALTHFMYEPSVLTAAAEAVFNLSLGSPRAQVGFIQAGTCEALVGAMKAHISNTSLQLFCCGSSVNLGEGKEAALRRFHEAGACEAMYSVLDSNVSDSYAVCSSCRGIATLCLYQPSQATFLRLGLVRQAKVVLAGYADNRDVQLFALEMLARLVDQAPVEAGEELIRLGIGSLLSKAMVRFGEDKAVSAEAIGALVSIVTSCGAAQDHFSRTGCCTRVMELLSTFPEDEGFQIKGLTAVSCLCRGNSTNRQQFASVNAAQWICDVTLRHMESSDLVTAGLTALDDLWSGTDLSGSGAFQLIPDLLNTVITGHASKPGILDAALQTMTTFLHSGGVHSQDTLGQSGACATVVTIIFAHMESPSTVAAALDVISALALAHEDNHERFGEKDALAVILQALGSVARGDRVLTLKAWRALTSLAQDDPLHQEYLREQGLAPRVCELLASSKGDGEAVVVALRAIPALAWENPEAATSLIQAGILPILIDTVVTAGATDDVLAAGLEALATFRPAELLSVQASTGGDLQKLVRASAVTLAATSKDARSGVLGLSLLAGLATSEGVREALNLAGAPDLVLAALRAHPEDPQIISRGAAALCGLLHSSHEKQASLVDAGIIALLTDALVSFPDAPDLHRKVLQVLVTLSWKNTRAQDQLGQATVCRTLCSVLAKNPSDIPLRILGYALIGNVAWQHAANQERLGEAGACELVCEEATLRDRTAVVQACRAIISLCASDTANQDRLGTAGAAKVIGAALRFPGDRVLLIKGAQAGAHLVHHNQSNQDQVCKFGLHILAAGVMGQMVPDAEIQVHLLTLLYNLTKHGAVQEEFGGSGACDTVCRVLQAHGRSREHLLYGLGVLVNLSSEHPANRTRFARGGACPVICAAVTDFGQDAQVVTLCLRCMALLASEDGDDGALLIQSGVAAGLSKALTASPADAVVYGLSAVARLAWRHAKDRAALGQADICQSVMGALERFPEDKSVQRYGWDAIFALARQAVANRDRLKELGVVDKAVEALKDLEPGTSTSKKIHLILRKLDPEFHVSGLRGKEEGDLDMTIQPADLMDVTTPRLDATMGLLPSISGQTQSIDTLMATTSEDSVSRGD
jgi:hypothetical protein